MQIARLKRNVFRSLLVLHFIGLSLSIGGRLADFMIERHTGRGAIQALVFGRDLTGVIARGLVLPGFLLMVATGVTMTFIRYGRRPPIWVGIKLTLNLVAYSVASFLVAPALAAARHEAHLSNELNRLVPQFQESAAHATFYGGIVFILFLLCIPVAVWKPFSSVNIYKALDAKASR